MLTNNFKKTDIKSPCGGIFTIYIDIINSIIYKKINNPNWYRIQTKINIYKNILNNLHKIPILGKYILEPDKIKIENDGSYYSKFISNGIRLYDIKKNTKIDSVVLEYITEKVLELKKDLNEYVIKNKLSGDWALHNLMYCIDRKKIYNVDLEGFYTYPLIHDNGNCNINYCNKRFDTLISILENINQVESINFK